MARNNPNPTKKHPRKNLNPSKDTIGEKEVDIVLPGGKHVKKKPRKYRMGGGAVCGAERQFGGKCQRAAGMGTDHPGIGRCSSHGGKAPATIAPEIIHANDTTSLARTRRQVAAEARILYGAPIEMDPYEAIKWIIEITAGEVNWLNVRVQEVQEHEWTEDTIAGKAINHWARLRTAAMERLFHYSATAIKLGLAERQVSLAEDRGRAIGQALQGILTDLELTDHQKEIAPTIVRKHLMLLVSKQPKELASA